MSRKLLPEPVEAFDSEVTSILDSNSSPDAEALASLMVRQSGRIPARRLVEAVCADRQLASRCFGASLAHPLGFDKFFLLSAAQYQLRLHIWWPGALRGREDIHTHRFSFVSGVITGQLRVSSYETCTAGVSMQKFKEARNEADGGYSYFADRPVDIRRTSLSVFEAGSTYFLRSTVLHRVDVPSTALVATLFLRVGNARKSTFVLTEPGSGAPAPGVRSRFKPSEAESRLVSFVKLVS